MISWHVRQGDSHKLLEKLNEDPDERTRYRLILTSPPYYGHRHYGNNNNEVGQEKTDKQFIESLVDIFVSARDLLTDDGSLWM
jgi:tRNA1(Val) A37 N6-methylase TrmN6